MTAQPTTSAKIKFSWLIYRPTLVLLVSEIQTRRPASNDRTVHRQFQATGQPVSRTHASDAMTSRLPRYKAKCGATQVLPMRVVPFAFRYQGNRATPCQYIDTTRKAIDCASTLPLRAFFYIIKLCSRLFVLYCRNCPKDDKFRYFIRILTKSGAA